MGFVVNTNEFYTFSVRLTSDEKAILDSIIAAKSCTRAEAIRLALRVGAPLLAANISVNLTRVLMALEILLAECLERVDRRDPEKVAQLVDTAAKRVDEFHA